MNATPQQKLREVDVNMNEYYRPRTFWQSRANLDHLPHVFGEYPEDLPCFALAVRTSWPRSESAGSGT